MVHFRDTFVLPCPRFRGAGSQESSAFELNDSMRYISTRSPVVIPAQAGIQRL
jgi:hypothetical protein